MFEKVFNFIGENINFDYILYKGLEGWGEYFVTVGEFYSKRRDVGFGVIDSFTGGINETNRKFLANFNGEEFKEDRKCIEWIDK